MRGWAGWQPEGETFQIMNLTSKNGGRKKRRRKKSCRILLGGVRAFFFASSSAAEADALCWPPLAARGCRRVLIDKLAGMRMVTSPLTRARSSCKITHRRPAEERDARATPILTLLYRNCIEYWKFGVKVSMTRRDGMCCSALGES